MLTRRQDRIETLVMILAAGLLLLAGLQGLALLHERHILLTSHAGQESAIQQANQMRAQLQAVATKTARLAADGDDNAKSIIDDLRRQGINVEAAPD